MKRAQVMRDDKGLEGVCDTDQTVDYKIKRI